MEYLDRFIFSDENRIEQGILQNFEIDLDLTDTKDFELKVDAEVAQLKEGYFWFMDNEEYGGIVDKVTSDSEDNTITYRGRNARGILASKVIIPPSTTSYKSVSGDVHDCINDILESTGLDSLFVADRYTGIIDNTFVLPQYDIPRFCTVYYALTDMLAAINASMVIRYLKEDHKWHIKGELNEDFSDYLSYCRDNSISYKVESTCNAVNHMICYSSDDDGSEYIIHLFTDEDGNIQDYVKDITYELTSDTEMDDNKVYYERHSDSEGNYIYEITIDTEFVDGKNYFEKKITTPLEDSDYILDESKKVLSGIHEYMGFYDWGTNAVENFKLQSEQPANWANNFADYAYMTNDYIKTSDFVWTEDTEINPEKTYYRIADNETVKVDNPVAEELENYLEAYIVEGRIYYILNGSDYNEVSEPDTSAFDTYYVVSDSYYTQFSWYEDGSMNYIALTEEPSDWETNYSSYYVETTKYDPETTETTTEHTSVNADSIPNYKQLSKQPDDWGSNFTAYFTRSWDGTKWDYSSVSNQINDYRLQTAKPTDWADSYSSAYHYGYFYTKNSSSAWAKNQYYKLKNGKYSLLSKKPSDWKKNYKNYYIRNRGLVQVSGDKAPTWNTNTYYSCYQVQSPPKYVQGTYFWDDSEQVTPDFGWQQTSDQWVVSGKTYYTRTGDSRPYTYTAVTSPKAGDLDKYYELKTIYYGESNLQVPAYIEGNTYLIVLDHYSNMITEGINELYNLRNSNEQEINLEDFDVKVGDFVGGEDLLTGRTMREQVTNMVVRLDVSGPSIEYTVGGTNNGY